MPVDTTSLGHAARMTILLGLAACYVESDRPEANTSFSDDAGGQYGSDDNVFGGPGGGSSSGSGDGTSGGSGSANNGDPNADSDGDGFTNAEEEAAGTNPDYKYSHPYIGEYRVGFCERPPATTGPTLAQSHTSEDGSTYDYAVLQNGDVPDNFTIRDQHGEDLDLYSFCGTQVMVVVSAGWCGPCRGEAEGLQAVADAHPSVQIITMLKQDNVYETPSQAFVSQWANDYGFENVAVGNMGGPQPENYEEYFDHPSTPWEMDGYLPTVYHLDETLTVISADEGITEPPAR